ncbi:cobalt ABC transporter ATP-binding protein [Oceanicola sp. 22II-s10i]|nr:cobalt ABC transporter ATP-binding protein [Oceanicola sp. 22II-s10i]
MRNVEVEKDGIRILSGLTLDLSERRIGIVGRNGSGKSTFARLLNGLERPSAGQVLLDGDPEPRGLRRHVGFVFQNPDNQIVYPNVGEDLEFGLKNLRLPPEERRDRIATLLDTLQLSHLRDRLTHTLSGGEKQLIALAGVLVMRPDWIVLDEPTTLLDLWNTRRFMRVLDGLEQRIVMVSHHLDLMQGLDRVLHIADGTVADDGPPAGVIAGYVARSEC